MATSLKVHSSEKSFYFKVNPIFTSIFHSNSYAIYNRGLLFVFLLKGKDQLVLFYELVKKILINLYVFPFHLMHFSPLLQNGVTI